MTLVRIVSYLFGWTSLDTLDTWTITLPLVILSSFLWLWTLCIFGRSYLCNCRNLYGSSFFKIWLIYVFMHDLSPLGWPSLCIVGIINFLIFETLVDALLTWTWLRLKYAIAEVAHFVSLSYPFFGWSCFHSLESCGFSPSKNPCVLDEHLVEHLDFLHRVACLFFGWTLLNHNFSLFWVRNGLSIELSSPLLLLSKSKTLLYSIKACL